MVERFHGMEEVRSSILLSSTETPGHKPGVLAFLGLSQCQVSNEVSNDVRTRTAENAPDFTRVLRTKCLVMARLKC